MLVDINLDSHLNFDEFSKIIELTELKDHNVEQLFRFFDADNDGFMDVEEIKKVMINWGVTCTEEEARDIVEAVDLNEDGKVSLKEFSLLMIDKSN